MKINGSKRWLHIALHSATPISIKIGMFGVRPCSVFITLMGLSLDCKPHFRLRDQFKYSKLHEQLSQAIKSQKIGYFAI